MSHPEVLKYHQEVKFMDTNAVKFIDEEIGIESPDHEV